MERWEEISSISSIRPLLEEDQVLGWCCVGPKEEESRTGSVNHVRRSLNLVVVVGVAGGGLVVEPRKMKGRKKEGTDEEEEARK